MVAAATAIATVMASAVATAAVTAAAAVVTAAMAEAEKATVAFGRGDGNGRHDNRRHDDVKGQQSDRRYDAVNWRHDDGRHNDGKGRKEAAASPPAAYQPQHHCENVYKSRHLDLFKLIYSI